MQTLPELLRSQARHFRHKTFLIWTGPGPTGSISVRSKSWPKCSWTTADHLHIIDRKKDVIISGGFNIYPIEMKDVLYKREDIYLCALIGAPDEDKGELPVAYVVPAAGKSPTAEELIAYCRANLAAYEAPRRVVFKDALPLGPTGKILKKELRDMIAREPSGS